MESCSPPRYIEKKIIKHIEIKVSLKRYVHIYKNMNEIIFNSNIRDGLQELR